MNSRPRRRSKKFLPKSPDAEPDLRRAIDTIPQLVWSAFPDGAVEFCNRRWLEYTGFTAEEAEGWGWRGAIHPEDLDKLVATWRRVLAEGVPGEAEARIRKENGSFRWFLIRAKPLRDDEGRIVRWYGTNTDIDERKQAEERLSQATDRLRLAMEASASVAWDSEVKSGRDVWFGDLQTIFGIASNTYEGSVEEFIRYVHPDDRPQVSQALADARQNRKLYAAEFRIVRPDGTVRWVVARGKFYYATNGDPERMLGVSLDITDRKQAEDALRESEARLRLAAQIGKMYAYEWDVATDRVVRSEECMSVLGSNDQAKQLTRQQILASVHADDRALFVGSVDQLTPDNPTTRISYRALRPDGSLVWLEKNARAFFDEKGKMLRMVGMVADITERKGAEAALTSARRRLIEAQEQERARIARELHDHTNQRLALLAIGIEELMNDVPNQTAEFCARVGELREQTLEISRDVQALSHELHSSKLAYVGLVAATRGFCKEFGEQQKLKIGFESHDLPSHVPPDVSLCLFRVLQEALRNAAKHSGGKQFEVELWGTSDEIHLTISDSGVGFELEAARLGPGLGLTSMQERMQLMQGTLSIESGPKRGTTIHARVPLSSGRGSMRATA